MVVELELITGFQRNRIRDKRNESTILFHLNRNGLAWIAIAVNNLCRNGVGDVMNIGSQR